MINDIVNSQLMGDRLQGFSFQELQKLEDLVLRGLTRVSKAKVRIHPCRYDICINDVDLNIN